MGAFLKQAKIKKQAFQKLGDAFIGLQEKIRTDGEPEGEITKSPEKFIAAGIAAGIAGFSLFESEEPVSLRALTEAAATLIEQSSADSGTAGADGKSPLHFDRAVIDTLNTEDCVALLKTCGIEVATVEPRLIQKNAVRAAIGDKLEQASHINANIDFATMAVIKSVKGSIVAPKDLEARAESIAQSLAAKLPGANPRELQSKLERLFAYTPKLADVLDNSVMSKPQAALWAPLVASAPVHTTLDAIHELNAQLGKHLLANKSGPEISKLLDQGTHNLQQTGSVFGRAMASLRTNPSNNDQASASGVTKHLAAGRKLATTESVAYGFANKSPEVPPTHDQKMLDELLGILNVDTSACQPDTELLFRQRGDAAQFDSEVKEPVRELLLVDQKVKFVDPKKQGATAPAKAGSSEESTPLLGAPASRSSAQEAGAAGAAAAVPAPDAPLKPGEKMVTVKQGPLLLTLEHIVCGRDHLVNPKILDVIDASKVASMHSASDPEFAAKVEAQFHNSADMPAQLLKRKLVAFQLMRSMFLEGTSASETAKDVAPFTLAGLGMEGLKHFIPDGIYKTATIGMFFLGADLGDNAMGCLPELKSQLETLGIHIDSLADLYEPTFGKPRPDSLLTEMADYASLVKPSGKAAGPAGEIVKQTLQSVALGAVAGNVMTYGYAASAGLLAANPAVTALAGMLAITGTSLGPAIGFATAHADLTLGYKKQLHDKQVLPPAGLDMNNPKEVDAFCSRQAKKQLMIQSGNGAGAMAFMIAPLASSLNLGGFFVSPEAVQAAIEPFMPGMENIARVGAMKSHEQHVTEVLESMERQAVAAAASGNTTSITSEQLESDFHTPLNEMAATLCLIVGGIFLPVVDRSSNHRLQVVGDEPGGAAAPG
ncbi:MAG: hypothetical protein V4754_12770 [Pseudomonadota bacterium]